MICRPGPESRLLIIWLKLVESWLSAIEVDKKEKKKTFQRQVSATLTKKQKISQTY
jgi:hypothetical protein